MPTFRDYMECSLYAPKEGFYASRASRADFYTAPELSPVFAEILTAEICGRLDSLAERHPDEPLFIVEAGSGDGTLARQVLGCLRASHPKWAEAARYVLVERVELLLLDSILSLRSVSDRVLGYTRLGDMPAFCGVIFSNELIDALPVHVLEKRAGRVGELYVETSESGAPEPRVGELSRRELAAPARAVSQSLPEGGRHSVNLEMRAWLAEAAQVLRSGSVITIDYGALLEPGAPNPPRFYQSHSTGSDIVSLPGSRDLTASVDFSAMIREGERLGLKKTFFSSFGRFLLDRGVLEMMPPGESRQAYTARNQIKTLFHPEGMGESFKVLIQEKDI